MRDDSADTVRRIVTANDSAGRGVAISDGPAPDVQTDPARPGFTLANIWVTENSPIHYQGEFESVRTPHGLEPPVGGSICRVVTVPPDSVWRGKVGEAEVNSYFHSVGSPKASTYTDAARHPYMQRTRTLDLCIVLDGEITLVLDKEDVNLQHGDVIIQRGTNHAWSNQSNGPCRIAITSYDGQW